MSTTHTETYAVRTDNPVFTNNMDRKLYKNRHIASCFCGRYRLYQYRCEISKEVISAGTWRTTHKVVQETRDAWFVADVLSYATDPDHGDLETHACLPQEIRNLFVTHGTHIDQHCSGLRTWLKDKTLAHAVLYYIAKTECTCGQMQREHYALDPVLAVSLQVRRLARQCA